MTHRHLGNKYPIQNIGHADIVQTQNGDWYGVCLGNRHILCDSLGGVAACPLGRETWLVEMEWQNGQMIMAPGSGMVESKIRKPNLPSTPFKIKKQEYIPMTDKSLRLEKVTEHEWSYTRKISDDSNESGIVLFRTVNSYYALLKDKDSIVLKKIAKGKESVVEKLPFRKKAVTLGIKADGMSLEFTYDGKPIGAIQSLLPLCDDGKFNKFNGLGVGYITK